MQLYEETTIGATKLYMKEHCDGFLATKATVTLAGA